MEKKWFISIQSSHLRTLPLQKLKYQKDWEISVYDVKDRQMDIVEEDVDDPDDIYSVFLMRMIRALM